MLRTTTCGRFLTHAAALFALQACVGQIGEGLGAEDGRPDAEAVRDGSTRRPIDARSGDARDVSLSDAGVTPPTDDSGGGSSPPPEGGSIIDGGGSIDGAAPPTSCTPPPRQLRLLTRREYRNVVRDLFQLADPSAPCPPSAFAYDAAGKKPTKVHVAGTFNNWAKTVADGGWPLQFDATKQLWTVQRDLPAGDYAYKFVIDESEWVPDTGNPRQTDDGQGGKNSLLTVTCGGATDGGTLSLALDPTATFPVESRPRKDNLSDLFPFDDASEKQVVSPTHIEEYWRAGKTIADSLTDKLPTLVACNVSDSAGCTDKFVRQFGMRAFRRPLTDPEVARYTKLVASATSLGQGLANAVRGFLSSPNFLYRSEGGQIGSAATGRLAPYETASALSFLFWGSMPDQALFDAAAAGQLDSAAGIEKQARRLLADTRSRTAVAQFASQWLGAEEMLVADKDTALFPTLTADLRAAMIEETKRFVTNVVFDSTRRYDELLHSDYTFVNADLAALYGISGVSSKTLQKQKYVDSYRTGILGHASLLGTYARSDQTSPIKRGLFVRRRLLCQDLPPPPANVPPVPAVDQKATTRERFRQHTSVAGCASCHQYIDGIGFGFERFDAIGKLRDLDNGQPIDSSGDMNDVEGLRTNTSAPYNDVRGLADVLASSTAAKNCLATQFYRYSSGMFESDQSTCAIGQIQTRFRDSGFDIQELMIALTQTSDFVTRH